MSLKYWFPLALFSLAVGYFLVQGYAPDLDRLEVTLAPQEEDVLSSSASLGGDGTLLYVFDPLCPACARSARRGVAPATLLHVRGHDGSEAANRLSLCVYRDDPELYAERFNQLF